MQIKRAQPRKPSTTRSQDQTAQGDYLLDSVGVDDAGLVDHDGMEGLQELAATAATDSLVDIEEMDLDGDGNTDDDDVLPG